VVVIKVPTNKKIRFDESLDKLHAVNVRVQERKRWAAGGDFDIDFDEYFDYRTNVDYIMNSDGTLRDLEGNKVNSDYRYKVNTDSISIEQQRKKVEDEQRKLKEMEEKKKTTKVMIRAIRNEAVKATKVEKDAMAGSPSPLFSLVNLWN
jgi:hypothetical protein